MKSKSSFFRYCLWMSVFLILFSGLSACGSTMEEKENEPVVNEPVAEEPMAEEMVAVKPERKYPAANDRMVYIPVDSDGGTAKLLQFSLDGEMQKMINLPAKKYGGTSEYDLLWVDNDELLWSVYVDGEGDDELYPVYVDVDGEEDDELYYILILSTPIRQEGSEEEVLVEETKELFTLSEEDDISIWGIGDKYLDTADVYRAQSMIYVDKNRIFFFNYGELYEYDRERGGKPFLVEPSEGEEGFAAVSAMMMNDQMIYHSGRTWGKVDEDAYEFQSYNLTTQKWESIDSRCHTNAAYVTDPVRNKVYYQIIDDQSIWEYDSVEGKKKELVSEKDLKACYEQNQISWDDGYYDDLLFVEGDSLYYVKNKKEPVLFTYSFTDGTLSYEKELTEAVRDSWYSDGYITTKLTVLMDKLLLYIDDTENITSYYLCVDLKTAEIKAVTQRNAEFIYFGILGEWYDSDTKGKWGKKTKKEENQTTAGADKKETVEDQIALISSESDQWIQTDYDGKPREDYYAVTDLDHNGRLELIASSGPQGTGRFTTSEYYQISMDGSKLRRVYTESGISDADIVNRFDTAYVDTKTDTYYYCVYDFVSAGAGARYIWYGAMVLKDGMITGRTYADGESTWNKKKTDEVWYYSYYKDGKEKKIKENKFDPDSLAEKFFAGFEKRNVKISWFCVDENTKLTKKKIRKMLTKSYQGFQVK